MTVKELRERLAGLPDWQEVKVANVGGDTSEIVRVDETGGEVHVVGYCNVSDEEDWY